MSFGRLSDVILDIQKEIDILMKDKNLSENQLFEKNAINNYIMSVITPIKNKYPEITFTDIENIFTRLFSPKFIYNKELDFSNGQNCFRDLDKKFTIDEIDTKIIKVPAKYKIRKTFSNTISHTTT